MAIMPSPMRRRWRGRNFIYLEHTVFIAVELVKDLIQVIDFQNAIAIVIQGEISVFAFSWAVFLTVFGSLST